MALGGRLAILTQPVQDAGALRSAVESVQAGDSRANLGELAHGARALAETVHTPIELHLFSDMQKTGVPANFGDMALPANVKVVLHSVGSVTPNWTIESVNAPAQVADVKDPKKSRVQAVIAGYGTAAATKTVSLVVNGNAAATRKVVVPANGRATVEFAPLDVPYGLSRCAIRIDAEDGFPADDSSVFSVRRSDPERVLFVHQENDRRSAIYFGAALAAPVMLALLLTDVAMAVLARSMPLLNVFVLSFSVKIVLGLTGLAASIKLAEPLLRALYGTTFEYWERAASAH